MKQIIYNTATQQLSRIFQNGYKVDGQQGTVDTPLLLLEVIDDVTVPSFDSATQYITSAYVIDEVNNEYRLEYTVHAKTAEQLEQETLNQINWQGLRIDLNQSAFYPLALSQGDAKIFSVIMTALAQGGRWVNDLNFSMSAMAQELFAAGHLSQAQINDLNIILVNNQVPFTITVS